MAYKMRTKPNDYVILTELNKRMSLSEQDKQYLYNLKKGYEGEQKLDHLLEQYHFDQNCYVLNDIHLKYKNTSFQIDTLLIFLNRILFFEVKNYEGDYFLEGDKFYLLPKQELTNPLNQLNRTESLLRQFILNLGFDIKVDGILFFINPEFTLYQAPLNKPYILPTQIERYIKQLKDDSPKISRKMKKLADLIVTHHHETTPFSQVPPYKYEDLKKGISCGACGNLETTIQGRNCICSLCSYTELVSTSILRSINEFKILFPNAPITTSAIYDFCKIISSRKRINRVLVKNFHMVGSRKIAHYE